MKWKFALVSFCAALAASVAFAQPAKAPAAPKPAPTAQQSNAGAVSLDGYTDPQGNPKGAGDTELSFSDIGPDGKHTVTVHRLYAYGDRPTPEAPNRRLAELSKNPEYFRGAKLCVMNLGDMYGDTGRLARDVDLSKAIGCAPVDVTKDSATISVAKPQGVCKPVNWVLKLGNGDQVWGGHPGWARENKRTGQWLVLAEAEKGPQGDERFPATVWCREGSKIRPMTADEKAKIAKFVQAPMFSTPERQKEIEKGL